MKRNCIKLLGFAAIVACLFSACNKESYRHQTEVVYPSYSQGYIFADQTEDSIVFVTFDSYRYYAYDTNPDNFISIDENRAQKKIVNSYSNYYVFSLPVYFKPNTSDKCRRGYVLVNSKSEIDDWNETVGAEYYQVNWHNIQKPAPYYTYDEKNAVVESCLYQMTDSAYQVADTLKFTAYDAWEIASANADIVKPLTVSGRRGNQLIPCEVVPNTTPDTLRTELTLTSANGAKTVIKFVQAPVKKKN